MRPSGRRGTARWVGASWLILAAAFAAVPPPLGEAQTAKRPRVGVLSPHRCDHPNNEALRRGLRELGYVEGQTFDLDCRGADGRAERLPDLARELLAREPDVLVTDGTVTTRVAQRATRSVPIVMGTVGDPVGSGFVQSLARPGGNTTGLTLMTAELNPKRLELLREVVPGARRIALLFNPDNPNRALFLGQMESAARAIGVSLVVAPARGAEDLEAAFAAMVQGNAGGLVVLPDPILFGHRARIVALAAQHRLPGMYESREFVHAGGLTAYGPNIPENFHRAASLVDKILKGTSPAELPVEQPAKVTLAVNLRTAKTLGLTIAPAVLARADEIVE